MFFGDQLTEERARASKKARIAADTAEEALDGLEPAASDWHAEFNFLQVALHSLILWASSAWICLKLINQNILFITDNFCTPVQGWIKFSRRYTLATSQPHQSSQCSCRYFGKI